MTLFIIIATVVWVYLLTVLHRAKLHFFKFLLGSVGFFLLAMVALQPVITVPLQKCVAAATGVFGNLSHMFECYYQYSLIFINNGKETISLYIDYECSGVIEMLAFISLLAFFPVYNLIEKCIVGVSGIIWIFLSNILRLILICALIYFFGNNMYFFAHAIFGRIIFYILTIILYFNVFTRSQIIRQKVGRFTYAKPNQ